MTLFALRYTYISSAGPTAGPLCVSLLTWHLEEKRLKSRFHTFVCNPPVHGAGCSRARGGLFQLQEVDSRAQSWALGIMTTVPPLSFRSLNGGWLPGTPGDGKAAPIYGSASVRLHILFDGLKTLLPLNTTIGKTHLGGGDVARYTEFTACRHGGGTTPRASYQPNAFRCLCCRCRVLPVSLSRARTQISYSPGRKRTFSPLFELELSWFATLFNVEP